MCFEMVEFVTPSLLEVLRVTGRDFQTVMIALCTKLRAEERLPRPEVGPSVAMLLPLLRLCTQSIPTLLNYTLRGSSLI